MALAWSISSNADEYKRTICLEWQLKFAEGDTATVLAQAADADLLIGTRTNQDWTGDVSGPGAASLLVLGVASARPRAEHGVLRPVEDRVVVHAHCPVVTVNGPGPIVGQDSDKIVVGWTKGTGGNGLAGTSFRTNQRRGSALRLDSSDREHLLGPKNRRHAQERSGRYGVGTIVGQGRPARVGLASQRAGLEHSRRTDR